MKIHVRVVDRYVLAIVVGFIAIAAVIGFSQYYEYRDLRAEREAQVAAQARAALISFEAQSKRLFDYGDGVVLAARHYHRRDGVSGLDDFIRSVFLEQAGDFLGAMTVTDAAGLSVFHSEPGTPSGGNLAEREYFLHFRADHTDHLFIGPTAFGAITRQWWFRLVRPILADGHLAGVVILTMRPEHISTFYQTLALGPHSSAAMMTLDRRLVARQPMPPTEAYGRALNDRPLWGNLSLAASGQYRATDDIDGVTRTYYYQKSLSYPLVLEIGVADQDVEDSLAGPRAKVIRQYIVVCIALAAVCLLVLALRRKARILAEQDAHLEERLASSEARFQGLVEQALVGIYILQDSRFSYVNPAFRRIFGCAPDEDITGRSPLDFVAPHDRARVNGNIRRRTEGELTEVHYSFEGRRLDGGQVFVEVHGAVIDAGTPATIVGTVVDVTEAYRAEAKFKALNADLNRRVDERTAELRASAARLKLVIETAAEGVFGIDDEARIMFANRAAADMLGWTSPEMLQGVGLSRALVHRMADGQVCDDETCQIHQTLRDGRMRRVTDEYFEGLNQGRRPVEYSASPLLVEGIVVGAVVVFHDITARRQAQDRIDQLLAYQRAILGNTPVGIAIFDLGRHILQANSAFCRIFGHADGELIGQHAAVLHEDSAHSDNLGQRAYPIILSGGNFSDEVRMRRADGSEIWVALEGHMVDAGHPQWGVVWAVIDVTERMVLDLELRRSNEELERFAYVASHDLRQPLRMVSSYLSLIQRRMAGRLEEEETEFLGYAIDGARRMDQMIIDLLDYSRIGRSGAAKAMVPLEAVIGRALDNLGAAIVETGTTISVDPGLPVVLGYESELERLFQNLIGNAVKFRDPNRPHSVSVGCRDAAREWVVAVADNGIGIAPEDHDRLFKLFQRLVSGQDYEGTGIGLAACRKIVEHHGGRIWVESKTGQGSTFFVALPKG